MPRLQLDSFGLSSFTYYKKIKEIGSGCGCASLGSVVASTTRGPRFESSHWQKISCTYLLLTVEKTKEKRGREWPF